MRAHLLHILDGHAMHIYKKNQIVAVYKFIQFQSSQYVHLNYFAIYFITIETFNENIMRSILYHKFLIMIFNAKLVFTIRYRLQCEVSVLNVGYTFPTLTNLTHEMACETFFDIGCMGINKLNCHRIRSCRNAQCHLQNLVT